jgi:hypothetical protein
VVFSTPLPHNQHSAIVQVGRINMIRHRSRETTDRNRESIMILPTMGLNFDYFFVSAFQNPESISK